MDKKTNATFVNTVVKTLKEKDERMGKSVLCECGRNCYRSDKSFEALREINEKYKNLPDEERIKKLNEEFFSAKSDLHLEAGMIYTEYKECVCKMVDDPKDMDGFLCECTVGYVKALAEDIFKQKVEVTVMSSIIRGDDKCRIAVRLL